MRAENTPPCSKVPGGGTKNVHSPWSAPRERKRRSKAQPAQAQPAHPAQPLGSIEELEYTSPPKRHNGGSATSPAARELSLGPQEAVPFPSAEALGSPVEAGPLAQGLFAGDTHFSPLASGLAAPSFAASAAAFSQHPWQPGGAAAADRQRRQLRQASAFRAAAARQRSAAGGTASVASSGLSAGGSAQQEASAVFCGQLWQAGAPPGSQPSSLLPAAPPAASLPAAPFAASLPPPVEQACEPAELPVALEPAWQQQQQVEAPGAPAPLARVPSAAMLPAALAAEPSGRTAARCSMGQDMETDPRRSWGSDRSADISGWQEVQARLREEADGGGAVQLQGGLTMDEEPCAVRASADGSARGSLDGPACSDRQASSLPLRAAMREQWHSHLAHDGASPDPLLGGHQPAHTSSGRQRNSRGSNQKPWGCFSCASPFSCKQQPRGADSDDDEVVRRTTASDSTEGFVIRRKHSFASLSLASAAGEERGGGDPAASTADRLKRTTLNHPPQGPLAARQGGFTAGCTATPGEHGAGPSGRSPFSDAGSDDGSFSVPSGLRSLSVGLRDASIEELAGGLRGAGSDGAPTPTVDALNDMLKSLSLQAAHPKDAEALVTQACTEHSIQPNATTARTLEKMWAVHEQLYG